MDLETRKRIIKYWHRLESKILVRRALVREYKDAAPSIKQIRIVISNFETRGTVWPKTHDKKNTVRVRENIAAVAQAINQSPTRSTRKLAAQLSISRRSVQRILKEDLNLFPYKIQLVSKLNPSDYPVRLEFCKKMLEMLEADSTLIDHIFMSDEAHFDLNGNVNKQNCRFWAETNPNNIHEVELHPERVTVWCAVSSKSIIGPFFFEARGRAVTVNSQRYLAMLKDFFLPELRRKHIALKDTWFQQDGATPHIANIVMDLLKSKFKEKFISRNGPMRWPPRSPDLTPPDFFLWGYCKAKVYETNPRNTADLKAEITRVIRSIPQAMLTSVFNGMVIRLRDCIQANGEHLASVIFKK